MHSPNLGERDAHLELLDAVWHHLLAPYVRRHRLPPDPFEPRRKTWHREETLSAAWEFLQDEVAPCVRAHGVPPHDLLRHRARKWVWRQHRRQDPVGAAVYQGFGKAVRSLLAAGSGAVALRRPTSRRTQWLRDVVFPGSCAARVVPPPEERDIEDLLDLGGWDADLARGGKQRLCTWLRAWLEDLPRLWQRGPWPGCNVRPVFDAVLARVRAAATKIVASHALGDPDVADPRANAPSQGPEVAAIANWLTTSGLIGADAPAHTKARAFYRDVRRDLLSQTNRPRHKRCTRLATWMLVRTRDRLSREFGTLAQQLHGAELRHACVDATVHTLTFVLREWPTERDLTADFHGPRITRGIFPAVQRVQQAEDRDVVRQMMRERLEQAVRVAARRG